MPDDQTGGVRAESPRLTKHNPLVSIELPGETSQSFSARGLIVCVGPNNSGKTLMQRDIESVVRGGQGKPIVCTRVNVRRPTNFDEFINDLFAEGYARPDTEQKIHIGSHVFGHPEAIGLNAPVSQFRGEWDQFRSDWDTNVHRLEFLQHFGALLLTNLTLQYRLLTIQETGAFDAHNSQAANDLQALYLSESAQERLANETGHIFGNAAWLDISRGDGKFRILCSQQPDAPSDRDRRNARRTREYRSIATEGDGYKSYVAIFMALALGRRPVCLIDEPEAYLHPPQAYQLGKVIGEYGSAPESTTIVATHSGHVLRGILDGATSLTLIRLAKRAEAFTGCVFAPSDLVKIMEQPITRREGILDGLFADAAIVVEADGDRDVYETVLERVRQPGGPQIHFAPVSGNSNIAAPLHLYRKLRIPSAAITDMDTIEQYTTFENIVEAAESDAVPQLMARTESLVEELKKHPVSVTATEFKSRLDHIRDMPTDWKNGDDLNIERALTQALRLIRRIRQLKSGGLQKFAETPAIATPLAWIVAQCAAVGVFIVAWGELEDWMPDLMADAAHLDKAKWCDLACTRARTASPKDDDIWRFMRAVVSYLTAQQAR